jgi:hypothetical protein
VNPRRLKQRNGQPPNKANPVTETWPKGKHVSVVVFDTPDSNEFQIMADALNSWNSFSIANCSGVTFGPPTHADHSYVNGEPVPDYLRHQAGEQSIHTCI